MSKMDEERSAPMRITDSGTVFAGAAGSNMQSATFPIPCVTDEGRWLCTFRVAPVKERNGGQRTLLTWSDDRGRTWREPVEPFECRTVEGKPGLLRSAGLTALGGRRLLAVVCWVDHSDPDAPYFNEETEGLLDARILLSGSEDAGETWSPLNVMDTSPFNQPTPITGPILELDDELACQFELNKPYDDPEPWRHAPVLMFSPDGGHTWPEHAVVTKDPENHVFYWDQRPSLLPNGRVFNVFWTFDRQTSTYFNIHAAESFDHGRIWSELWDTGVPGQPAPVFPLRDGTLAMAHVDRTAAPAIKVRRSTDGGRTWPGDGELVVFESAGPTQTTQKLSPQDALSEMLAFSVGLPSTAPLPEGGALLVYYAGAETDTTGIHWAVIE